MKTHTIELVNDDGEIVITLSALKNGGGLWIKGKNDSSVANYNVGEQMAIGFYKDTKHATAMDVALTLEGIQFVDNGEVKFLEYKDLATYSKLIESLKK